MAGCNNPGGCACAARRQEAAPRESLTEALAKVIVDRRVVERALELYDNGVRRADDIVAQITAERVEGKL